MVGIAQRDRDDSASAIVRSRIRGIVVARRFHAHVNHERERKRKRERERQRAARRSFRSWSRLGNRCRFRRSILRFPPPCRREFKTRADSSLANQSPRMIRGCSEPLSLTMCCSAFWRIDTWLAGPVGDDRAASRLIAPDRARRRAFFSSRKRRHGLLEIPDGSARSTGRFHRRRILLERRVAFIALSVWISPLGCIFVASGGFRGNFRENASGWARSR